MLAGLELALRKWDGGWEPLG